MGSAIGTILPMAVGVALSLVPILAIVLLLGSPHGRSNGLAFTVGWVVGLALVGTITLLAHGSSRTSGNRVTSGIELAVGLFFVLLAWRIWRRRPERGEAPELPRWMRTIDSFTALKSLGSGAALSALNPKTLTLTILPQRRSATRGSPPEGRPGSSQLSCSSVLSAFSCPWRSISASASGRRTCLNA